MERNSITYENLNMGLAMEPQLVFPVLDEINELRN